MLPVVKTSYKNASYVLMCFFRVGKFYYKIHIPGGYRQISKPGSRAVYRHIRAVYRQKPAAGVHFAEEENPFRSLRYSGVLVRVFNGNGQYFIRVFILYGQIRRRREALLGKNCGGRKQ